VFLDVRDNRSKVIFVDLATQTQRVLAEDRQVGMCQATGTEVPVYGPHWAPGSHRDLEMIDVRTGRVRTVLTVEAVLRAYPEPIQKHFQDRPVSIFFPVLSPDRSRVFFKMAASLGGDARSKKASQRELLICYDLQQSKFLFIQGKWGHPAWHPDSRTILQMGKILLDSTTGQAHTIPNMTFLRGAVHAAVSPDGSLMAADSLAEKREGGKGETYQIVVADLRGKDHVVLAELKDYRGAKSWRKSDPHPIFSPDGRRVYFNAGEDGWTRLYVAECGAE